jgi:phytanoyl-CoA hydroxylase
MFKVYNSIVDTALIDKVLTTHEEFKYGKLSYFRAQGTVGFEKPIIDKYGNQKNSIQNPHLLGLSKNFSRSVKDIIYSDSVYQCLVDFMDVEKIVHYQSMLFDRSTATKIHQDTWYLDTIPPGQLVGVWIALEDIYSDSGPFYVYSDSISRKLDPNQLNSYHNKFRFLASKGDILIWNSFALHGAEEPSNNSYTRKSITAHFYRYGSEIQASPIKRFLSVYNHKKPINTAHPKIHSATTISPFLYQFSCNLLARMGKLSDLITRDNSANRQLSEIRAFDEN